MKTALKKLLPPSTAGKLIALPGYFVLAQALYVLVLLLYGMITQGPKCPSSFWVQSLILVGIFSLIAAANFSIIRQLLHSSSRRQLVVALLLFAALWFTQVFFMLGSLELTKNCSL